MKDEQIQGLIDLRNRLDGIIAEELRGRALELRECRKKAGIGLREMAREMGISATHMVDLELGRKPWPQARRKRYEQILIELGKG